MTANAEATRAMVALPEPSEVRDRLRAIEAFRSIVHRELKEGSDYGTIPGTQKPTLLKPGGEKLIKLLGLADAYEVVQDEQNWDRGLFAYTVRCVLSDIQSRAIVGEGLGECNSMESRYRWRWVFGSELKDLGIASEGLRTRTINTKNGRATQYRIDNDDIYTLVNTILKMAKKRAMVDAALSAGRLSDVFTQDMEDIAGFEVEEDKERTEARTRPAERTERGPRTRAPQASQRREERPPETDGPGEAPGPSEGPDWDGFWKQAKGIGFEPGPRVWSLLNVTSAEEWFAAGKSLGDALADLKALKG